MQVRLYKIGAHMLGKLTICIGNAGSPSATHTVTLHPRFSNVLKSTLERKKIVLGFRDFFSNFSKACGILVICVKVLRKARSV